jgi:hypothetical protein
MKRSFSTRLILALVVLLVGVVSAPVGAEGDVNWNSGPPPGREQSEAPDNYLITLVTYPQLRGSECDDPYPTGDQMRVWFKYKDRAAPGVYEDWTYLGIGDLPGCAFQISAPTSGTPTYDFWVKVENHLTITTTAVLTGNMTLHLPQAKAGDGYTYYGDNAVDVSDYNECMSGGTFGSQYGDAAYKDQCDADGDGAITIAEYNVIIGNFGQTGAPVPWP